jgi:hypothetical protein
MKNMNIKENNNQYPNETQYFVNNDTFNKTTLDIKAKNQLLMAYKKNKVIDISFLKRMMGKVIVL